ncbi:MAG: dihydroneopterin aldolase [Saprospiraceae bacterium]|nr:dihydroneopterin aldolase [Saprospiraceae bacterium]
MKQLVNKLWNHIIKIELLGIRFFGSYGLYPVESLWNSELLMDCTLTFNINSESELELKDTVDYQMIYTELQSELQQKHKLLENIAIRSIKRIKNMDSRIRSCKIKIYKKPQLNGPLLHVAVELEF